MSNLTSNWISFFEAATGHVPYPYQTRLAERTISNLVVSVPTGMGKTAGAVLAWLWRRVVAPEKTPRRLVYCLPMRVLVEQTVEFTSKWVHNVGAEVSVYTLMGGEVEEEWELHPEKPAILVGTQDMLLSRALNRGYAMSRYKWPVHFGLLNNDCLWVCDEVQLMGSGLGTTAQLQAWREQLGAAIPCFTWWMSATMRAEWLDTVDFAACREQTGVLSAGNDDFTFPALKARREAEKPLARMGDSEESDLAARILEQHCSHSLTLAVVNTVGRAQRLYEALVKAERRRRSPAPELVLAHSRFRPAERKAIMDRIQKAVGPEGRIVVATQLVEAGLDVSARVLFMDLAPWNSVVQRAGRCNRKGEYGRDQPARVFWIAVGDRKASPYDARQLAAAEERLNKLSDISIVKLEAAGPVDRPDFVNTIRKKDLFELFDTTPDLSGADLDIARFIREGTDLDAQVFWREIPADGVPDPRWSPRKEELCPAPCYELEGFLKKRGCAAFRWDWLEGRWRKATVGEILPGEVYLLGCSEGGYSPVLGWNPSLTAHVPEVAAEATEAESYDSDLMSRGKWLTVAQHTDQVVAKVRELSAMLQLELGDTLALAARWHDRGKGHAVFQDALPEEAGRAKGIWAKAPAAFRRYQRRHFRHELASALAVLQEAGEAIPEQHRSLVAYLAAAHHGRIRLSIRSMPGETPHPEGKRFARGIWEGDILEELNLGGGVIAKRLQLSLAPMELGASGDSRSWLERMLELRDATQMGPFRLAYFEALLRSADRLASSEELRDE